MKTKLVQIHKDLIEQSKLGDRNAQYKLYELYVDAMYNVSMRMVYNKEDAEDIIQESFVETFKNLSSFRYESTFGTWLKRIVINKCINHLKLKRISFSSIEDQLYPLEFEAEQKETFDDTILNIQKIRKGIQLLPEGYKQIISLYLIEGYDHVEIAAILGISVSTSKSQYHRAKKKLLALIKTL